ncbi:MAG: flagellar biosynthetic protein FliO [Lachnospiraceae bacterium]|nr:flagellar biosynthetic protein FliO [Lachnospiraceae bacterium]
MTALLAAASGVDSAAQFFTVLLAFIFVLVITALGTRFLGNFQKMQNLSDNFESIEAYKLNSNTYLQLVKIGKEYYVLAVGKDQVTLITKVEEDELVLSDEGDTSKTSTSFGGLLEKAGNKLRNRGGDK